MSGIKDDRESVGFRTDLDLWCSRKSTLLPPALMASSDFLEPLDVPVFPAAKISVGSYGFQLPGVLLVHQKPDLPPRFIGSAMNQRFLRGLWWVHLLFWISKKKPLVIVAEPRSVHVGWLSRSRRTPRGKNSTHFDKLSINQCRSDLQNIPPDAAVALLSGGRLAYVNSRLWGNADWPLRDGNETRFQT